jgi:heptosyltransferase-2
VELVGWLGVPVRRTRPSLVVSAEARARRDLRAAGAGWPGTGVERAALPGYVVLNAGGRPASAKAWPAASWAALAAELAGHGRRLVLAAGPGEEAALDPVVAAVTAAAGADVLALVDPVSDLGELAAWIEAADVVVTADSGPRHLAVALGRPLAVVAGPTDPRHTADHLERTRLVRTPVDCGPCHRERCPLAGERHERCMRAVEPARLVEEALEVAGAGRG